MRQKQAGGNVECVLDAKHVLQSVLQKGNTAKNREEEMIQVNIQRNQTLSKEKKVLFKGTISNWDSDCRTDKRFLRICKQTLLQIYTSI